MYFFFGLQMVTPALFSRDDAVKGWSSAVQKKEKAKGTWLHLCAFVLIILSYVLVAHEGTKMSFMAPLDMGFCINSAASPRGGIY